MCTFINFMYIAMYKSMNKVNTVTICMKLAICGMKFQAKHFNDNLNINTLLLKILATINYFNTNSSSENF